MPHIHEKVDLVTVVYVVHNDRVLLRKHDKYKMWLGPGGHIELDEDPNEAAIREVKEEVGLDVELVGNPPAAPGYFENYKELIPPRFLNRHKINETHEHIAFVYFATTKDDQITQGKNEISDEIKWFTKKELGDPKFGISEHVQYYTRIALETLGENKH